MSIVNKKTLSVVLATRNEEANIGRCLKAVQRIASEIIIFDEYSKDSTVEIAKSFGARVFLEPHHEIFHITKQKAIDKAKGDWILQLDADEVVTPALATEIMDVINMSSVEVLSRKMEDEYKENLFKRHIKVLEKRDGVLGNKTGEVVAFFVPRKNIFLGKPLVHAGVYPDAVIRLIKKGKAYLPGKSVHEQMVINGQVSWLFSDLDHYDSPTLRRYISRLNRYTDLHADELLNNKTPKTTINFISYSSYKPLAVFARLYFRHAGFRDGIRGFLWSLFSAMHFPLAYYKYMTARYSTNE